MSTKVSTDLIDLSSNTGGLIWAKGTTAQQPASATAGEMRVDTTTATTLVYNGTQWKTLKETAFVVPPTPTHFLVVAGGGGGGFVGGGGGAGGLRTSYGSNSGGGGSAESTTGISLNTAYTITVGDAGLGGVSLNATVTSGYDSIFSTITSIGGGGGGNYSTTAAITGGSGGGGASSGSSLSGAAGTANQGFAGGNNTASSPGYGAGGGGGATAIGVNGTSTTGGNGGAALTSLITGVSTFYAGGGGGGVQDGINNPPTATFGTGGSGVGGNGQTNGSLVGGSGVFNTGSGGGGGGTSKNGGSSWIEGPGGSGGPGVVILRYPTADLPYFTTTGTLNTPSATDTVADAAYPVTNTAYYKLDSNANDSAQSGYIGQGGIFNGSSSKMVIPSPISNTSNVDFSISLWFKPNTTIGSGQYQHLIGQLSDSARSPIQITLNGTGTGTATIGLWRNYGNVLYYSPSNPSQTFAIGQWYNILISYTASNSSYVTYVNGVSLGSNTQQSLTSATTANTLTFGTYNSSYWVNGTIDQVRIYNTALSSSNVALLYAETSATSSTLNYPTGTGGQALYEFSGNADSTSSSAYNGTATDVLYAFNGIASNVTYGNGRFNEAASFTGTGSYISLPTGQFNYSNFTISSWVLITSTPSAQGCILSTYMYVGSGPSKGYAFRVNTNMTAGFAGYYDDSGNSNNFSTTQTVPLNTWTHLAVTYNSTGNIIIYINGTSAATQATASNPVRYETNNNTTIGALDYSSSTPVEQFFVGNIDQMRIFDSALAAGDVEDLYNEHFPTKFTDGSDTALMFTGGTGTIKFFDTDPIFNTDYLVVAGGGAGGGHINTDYGGGGGAGGMLTGTKTSTTIGTNYSITVGNGATSGTDGYDSQAFLITATGGGGGGWYVGNQPTAGIGIDGGSGGGGASGVAGSGMPPFPGGSGVSGEGNNGGECNTSGGYQSAGGGGAGAVGASVSGQGGAGGVGGVGLASTITGSSVFYAGGGGGSGYNGVGGTGGSGGGGAGASYSPNVYPAAPGTPNTGGGGGGGIGGTGNGGDGGSGVVILRYPNTKTITVGAGLTATTAAVGTDSVTTFTAGTGTITFS